MPSPASPTSVKKLTNWMVTGTSFLVPQPPNQSPGWLVGTVTGHVGFKDRTRVRTSRVIGCWRGHIITLSGSEYELGKPEKGYAKVYPDALAALIAALPSVDPTTYVSPLSP